jgi:hypothetical protein
MKDIYNLTDTATATLLKGLGYGAGAVADALKNAYNVSAEAVASILKDAGYAAEEVGNALHDACDWTADQINGLIDDIFGGTIICTELHRQGYMSDEVYAADVEYGLKLSPTVIKGYHFLAAPIVRKMQESKQFTDAVNTFAKPWAEEMAHEQGLLPQGNFWGAAIMFFGIPLCFVTGAFLTLGFYSIIPLVLLFTIIFLLAYRKGDLRYVMKKLSFNNL